SWRLTGVLRETVTPWLSDADAVRSGLGGAGTRRAQSSGERRTAVSTPAQRVVHAVASAQAGGSSYEALWQENERLKAANEALWQAWSAAEARREATHRPVAGSGCAMGLRL